MLRRIAGLSLFCVLAGSTLSASILTSVATRGGLIGSDTLDWAQLGVDGTGLLSPQAATSVGGLSVTASHPSSLVRFNEGGLWTGYFGLGDHLLATGGAGALTLDFAAAISGFGANAAANNGPSSTLTIEAFGAGLVSFGSFVVNSAPSGPGPEDGTAAFLGLTSDAQDIIRIVISSTNDLGGFAVNQLSLQYDANDPPPDGQVPEPSTWMLLASGAGLIGVARTRLRNR